jgi:hypothetical protein
MADKPQPRHLLTTLDVSSTLCPVYLVAGEPWLSEGDMGEYSPVRNDIRLRWGSDEGSIHGTLLHEVTHAAGFQAAIPNWADEKIVGPLAAALFDCLKRNDMLRLPRIPARYRGRR